MFCDFVQCLFGFSANGEIKFTSSEVDLKSKSGPRNHVLDADVVEKWHPEVKDAAEAVTIVMKNIAKRQKEEEKWRDEETGLPAVPDEVAELRKALDQQLPDFSPRSRNAKPKSPSKSPKSKSPKSPKSPHGP